MDPSKIENTKLQKKSKIQKSETIKMQNQKGGDIHNWLTGGPMETALGSFKDWKNENTKLQKYRKCKSEKTKQKCNNEKGRQ